MNGPVLLMLPDPEARVDPGRPVLGVSSGLRLADSAHRAGFATLLVAPGTHSSPPGALPGTLGDRVDAAALVIFESAAIEPGALRRLCGAAGEGSLFDERGRPVGWWSARLGRVPGALPVTEALAAPEAPAPGELARLVDAADLPRMEALIVRAVADAPELMGHAVGPWRRWLELPLLRWLCARARPPGRVELVALLLAALAGVPALLETRLGLLLSSITRHERGATASSSAARKYPSGFGLPRGTSSEQTEAASSPGLSPRAGSACSNSQRAEPVTIATGIACSRARASSSRAPGSSGSSRPSPNNISLAATVPWITASTLMPRRSPRRR